MQGLYRAIYTRCENGTDFFGTPNSKTEQKMFATGGAMHLSNELLSSLVPSIEIAIGRDIYNAGLRPYLRDACHYFVINDISIFIYYHWLNHDETGQREFGITKALIGTFNYHPIEFFSSEFFCGNDFYTNYFDANNKPIKEYKQLLSYTGSKFPPDFPVITQETLFSMKNCFPVMSFENARDYVRSSKKISRLVNIAVAHLVKQYCINDENIRKSIVIRGTKEQVRFMIAAIGYAFAARSSLNISFTIALPINGFAYNFSTAALIGWDNDDPDISKVTSLPSNMVYLEDIPNAEKNTYYSTISKFNDSHKMFIFEYMYNKKTTINNYPYEYENFIAFEKRILNEKEEARKKAEREENRRKILEKETRKKVAEEEARKKVAEEEAQKKAVEEEIRRKKLEEESRRKAEHEERKKIEEDEFYRTAKPIKGRLLFPGAIYEGLYICNNPHGWGAMLGFNGNWYTGAWITGKWEKGNCVKGFENMKNPISPCQIFNQVWYPGGYINGVWFEGFVDGVLFTGENDTMMQGWGAVLWPFGDWYTGELKEGKYHGWGIYRNLYNGQVVIGYWEDGRYISINDPQ